MKMQDILLSKNTPDQRFEKSKSGICETSPAIGCFDEKEDQDNVSFVNIAKCVPSRDKDYRNYQLCSEANEKVSLSHNVETTINENYEIFDLLIENPNSVSKSGVILKKDGSIIIHFNDVDKSQITISPNGKVDITNSQHNAFSLLAEGLAKMSEICDTAADITVTVSAFGVPTPIDNAGDFDTLSTDIAAIKTKLETFIT